MENIYGTPFNQGRTNKISKFYIKTRLPNNVVESGKDVWEALGVFKEDFTWEKFHNNIHPHDKGRIQLYIYSLLKKLREDSVFQKKFSSKFSTWFFSYYYPTSNKYFVTKETIQLLYDENGAYLVSCCEIIFGLRHNGRDLEISITDIMSLAQDWLLKEDLTKSVYEDKVSYVFQLLNPPQQRIVRLLQRFPHWTQKVLATMMEIRPNTVKVNIYRIMCTVKEHIPTIKSVDEFIEHL